MVEFLPFPFLLPFRASDLHVLLCVHRIYPEKLAVVLPWGPQNSIAMTLVPYCLLFSLQFILGFYPARCVATLVILPSVFHHLNRARLPGPRSFSRLLVYDFRMIGHFLDLTHFLSML